jgi:hypothetical protein
LDLVFAPRFKPLSSQAIGLTLLGVARYCALRVVTRIACFSKALSGTSLGRKLNKASKVRKQSFCPVGEREYGEGWPDVRWGLFRWIFPFGAGVVKDAVEPEKGEPFELIREREERRDFRGWGTAKGKGEGWLCAVSTVFPCRSTNKKGSTTVNSPPSLHSANCTKRRSPDDERSRVDSRQRSETRRAFSKRFTSLSAPLS